MNSGDFAEKFGKVNLLLRGGGAGSIWATLGDELGGGGGGGQKKKSQDFRSPEVSIPDNVYTDGDRIMMY